MSDVTLMQGDCLEHMKGMDDCVIDLTVTSPPYDNLRTYNGNSKQWGEHVWRGVIAELYRVTAEGGVVVWVVGDATVKGSETGTSFKQALHAMDCGFLLHDTMIYEKQNPMPNDASKRYTPCFEYMFVFSKGKLLTFNPIYEDCIHSGKKASRTIISRTGDRRHHSLAGTYKNNKKKKNIFAYVVGTLGGKRWKHPAKFPEKLARDHIISWSNEGDTVLDPFMGSGTTGKMAAEICRNFIGIELDSEYFSIAESRIHEAKQRLL